MVGLGQVDKANKPSRSDEVLDADQQLQITNQVRAQFDSMAPKRPTKPSRSDPDSTPAIFIPDENIPLPEVDKLRSLQSQSHALFSDANGSIQEEFVETQYYRELDSIDKQHHTTGNGFIKLVSEKAENAYDLALKERSENVNGGNREMVFKTNPATNDWIPNVEQDQVEYVPTKPIRSD